MSMRELLVQDFLTASQHTPVIDVRSPGEFEGGHIPGAKNIPLFSNEERAIVGTTYKQVGRDEAVLEGLTIVGPKMRGFVESSLELAPAKKVLVHCWRGGMRSSSFGWLLKKAGMDVQLLRGGYKSYRNYVLEYFEQPARLTILSGETGSGKTELLHELRKQGEQVIDLEGLAHHRGSAFGSLGLPDQPTTEQFHNLLHNEWEKLDLNRPVWMEDESFSIGKVGMPKPLWDKVKVAPAIAVQVPLELRINRLVNEYGKFSKAQLAEAVHKIKRKLGDQRHQQALNDLEENKLDVVAENMLLYYDKAYRKGLEKKPILYNLALPDNNLAANARKLIEFRKEIECTLV